MEEEVLGRVTRWIVYGRANQGGAEGEESLGRQADAGLPMAEGMGYVVAPENISFEVASGLELDRPKLAVVRGMAAAGELDGLYVYSPDRLCRDILHLQALLDEFRGFGVEVHFVMESCGLSPEWELLKVLADRIAESEKEHQRNRSILGKRAAALEGRMPIGGNTGLFGYDYDPVARKRTVNEAEAGVVVRCYEMVCEGWSLSHVCKILNDEGIRTKAGVPLQSVWLRRLLSNSSMMGVDYYGKTRSEVGPDGNKRRVTVAEEQRIKVKGFSPPIVSEQLFLKVQNLLPRGRVRGKGRGGRR